MIWVSVNPQLCWGVTEKCASTSLHKAFDNMPHRFVPIVEAAEHNNIVAVIRDPLERLFSVFNHFYVLSINKNSCKQFIKDGVITAFGAVLRAGSSNDFDRMNPDKKAAYFETIKRLRIAGESDSALSYRLDAIDYYNFVNNILNNIGTKEEDRHWAPQAPEMLLDCKNIVNDLYRFEDIDTAWEKYFPGKLARSNSHNNINKDVSYRIDELRAYYKADYEMRGAL